MRGVWQRWKGSSTYQNASIVPILFELYTAPAVTVLLSSALIKVHIYTGDLFSFNTLSVHDAILPLRRMVVAITW